MEVKESVSVWEKLKTTKKTIVLYGMGDGADKILNELKRQGISAAGVFASDEFCRGQQFRGFPVLNYAQAKERFCNMIVLVAFGTQLREVIERIRKIADEQELYVPDTPVAGEGIFDLKYLKAHALELAQVYGMLADEQSRSVFQNVLDYKISGKPEYLFSCESSAREAFSDVLRLNREESYVDVGAYTGDTVREFIDYARDYREIYAIEPDKRNYAKLQKYAEGLQKICCYNIAAHEQAGEIAFAARGGRNSMAGQGGMVVSEPLDRLFDRKRVTYIKYDVEGEELPALRGTERILREKSPKLLVSAYHRNEDLFAIPLLVKRIQQNYRVYLRHYSYLPAWDTNYYFV